MAERNRLTSEQVRALEAAGRLGGLHAMTDLYVEMKPRAHVDAARRRCQKIAKAAGFDLYARGGGTVDLSSMASILKQKYPQQNINALAFSKSPFYAMVRK